MKNPLKDLAQFGQSPWLDNLSRKLISSGELKRMVQEGELKGITSNPTIFEKSISGSSDYDPAIKNLIGLGEKDRENIFKNLAVADIQEAADLLLPVYRGTSGRDGFVSLEVSPKLAYDAEGTVYEAKELFAKVARKNVMIKVPATRQGLSAVEKLIACGINVNTTLLFSVERYEAAAKAYISGLERLGETGAPLSEVASVASFFISRIDTAVDKELEKKALQALLGKAAIANAKVAYQSFKRIFSDSRFAALKAQGARVQRPLWASTGTKNPNYSDVLYVEELIGPDTVNTLPPHTWDAFRDHGRLRASLDEDVPGAQKILAQLAKAGIDLAQITDRLEIEGVQAFAQSFDALICGISEKAQKLSPELAKLS